MSNANVIGSISPTILGAHRIAGIVAALTPPATTPGAIAPAAAPAAAPGESLTSKAMKFAPGAAGAAAGAYLWKNHRILGALAGHAIVNSGYDAMKGGDKVKSACQGVVEGAGVLGSLYNKKMPIKFARNPIIGYVVGVLAGAAATYFVPGSPIKDQIAKIKAKF